MSSGAVNPPRPLGRHPWRPPWAGLGVAALAFGIVEAILVAVYRTLLDPDGARFPLLQLPPGLLRWEQCREAATLVLLGAVARLATPRGRPGWAAFLFVFALWDLAYYATLRVVLGWPDRLSDWDLLFLFPVPWLGPVYAPLLASVVLAGAGAAVLGVAARRGSFGIRAGHVTAVALGGGLVVWSFIASPQARALASLPPRYQVELLLAGLGIAAAALVHALLFNLRRTGTAPPSAHRRPLGG
jgi:hypothetical protein